MIGVSVTEQSEVAEARRQAVGYARRLEFADRDAERVGLVATELATNLVRHATHGELLISAYETQAGEGLQLISLDAGPGMRDPELCLRDGYSTAAGSGTGLGAVRRLSDQFDLYSRPGEGTAVLVRIVPRGQAVSPRRPDNLDWDAIIRPKSGEIACGDGWSAHFGPTHAVFLVADGIGHGPMAAAATAEAVRIFRQVWNEGPGRIMQALHAGLAGTRGAAAAVVRIDFGNPQLTFCGIGNISATIFGKGAARKTVSQNGTLGHSVRKVQEFTYPFPEDAMLVMHSDGLSTNWALDGDPELRRRAPGTVAGVLHRRHRRDRDDTVLLVVKAA